MAAVQRLRPGDALLLGTDLVKDPGVLHAAYDDPAGITAAFNKNVLAVLNAELGADFDAEAFDDVAVWDADAEWMEMRLRSVTRQAVTLPAISLTVAFAEGEEMRTGVSAKFRRTVWRPNWPLPASACGAGGPTRVAVSGCPSPFPCERVGRERPAGCQPCGSGGRG